jgi:hypothetical protein
MAEIANSHWKYYVYQFYIGSVCVYVGKGSGKRFASQSIRFKHCVGKITAYFKKEEDALIHEAALIADIAPAYNKALMPANAKPWKYVLLPERDKDFYVWCEAIGTRQMATRLLLSKSWEHLRKYGVDIKSLLSKLEPWCEALNGAR